MRRSSAYLQPTSYRRGGAELEGDRQYVKGKQTIVRCSQQRMSRLKEQLLERLVLNINTLVEDVEHGCNMTARLMSRQPFLEHIYNMNWAWLPSSSSSSTDQIAQKLTLDNISFLLRSS